MTNFELIKAAREQVRIMGTLQTSDLLLTLADALEKSDKTVQELSFDDALNEAEREIEKLKNMKCRNCGCNPIGLWG